MFNDIGRKIKILADVLCRMGIVASVLGGIVTMLESEGEQIFVGGLIIIFGSLFSWFGSFFIYGYGELIDKVSTIETYITREHVTKD